MKRIIRRIGAALAAGALSVTALSIATAAPAQAASCATSVKLDVYKGSTEFGGYNSVSAQLSYGACDYPSAGTTTIQRSTDGGRTWTKVATSSGRTYAYFSGTGRFNTTARYRGVYTGGTYAGYSGTTTWTPSVSTVRAIGTYRKVSFKDKSTRRASRGQFVIRPAAAIRGMRATFQRKVGGKWKGYKKVRVSGTAKITVTFKNSRKGIKYRMVLPAGRGMVSSTYGPITARRY
ncbi:hypothetical protein [Nocardioides insulae]|uniref:hypothetical protein n=1 Tax=Nocardioides insulae TaxID=394734 RepID=UPI000411900A|nr:hypothetical protein [Nocardioides insulae]